jgi:hypothetical protein
MFRVPDPESTRLKGTRSITNSVHAYRKMGWIRTLDILVMVTFTRFLTASPNSPRCPNPPYFTVLYYAMRIRLIEYTKLGTVWSSLTRVLHCWWVLSASYMTLVGYNYMLIGGCANFIIIYITILDQVIEPVEGIIIRFWIIGLYTYDALPRRLYVGLYLCICMYDI